MAYGKVNTLYARPSGGYRDPYFSLEQYPAGGVSTNMSRPYGGTRTQTNTGKKRAKRYLPRVHLGRRVGRFRRGRRARSSKFSTRGVMQNKETGATVTDANLVSIGHSTMPLYESLFGVVRAIWRNLYQAAGFTMSAWGDGPTVGTDTITVSFEYRTALNDTTALSSGPTFAAGLNFYQMCQSITASILDTMTTSHETFQLEFFRLSDTGNKLSAEIVCRNASMIYQCTSILNIQNRTKGASTTDISKLDVTNNPLRGRHWTTRGNAMVAKVFDRDAVELTAEGDHGLITGTFKPDNAKVAQVDSFKYVYGTKQVYIPPGGIRTSRLTYRRRMQLNAYLGAIRTYIAVATSGATVNNEPRVSLGNTRYFQFEKLCDTRAGDQDILLGYEISANINVIVYCPKYVPMVRTAN